MNRGAVFLASVAVSLVLAAILASGCAHRPKPIPDPTFTPAEALSDALFDSCRSADSGPPTKDDAVCNKGKLAEVDVGILRLGRKIDEMSVTADARNQIFSVRVQELQGKLNQETARADRNARWIWYTVGGGIVLSVITLVVGAVAL